MSSELELRLCGMSSKMFHFQKSIRAAPRETSAERIKWKHDPNA